MPEFPSLLNRRHFLNATGNGLEAAALSTLLMQDARATDSRVSIPHATAKAKRVIYLFQSGGPSHLELLDHKPKLAKLHGTELPDSVRQKQRLTGMTSGQKSFPVIAPKFKFSRHGRAGAWLVDETFGAYLHHPADSATTSGFVQGLNNGTMKFSDVPVSALASAEFFANAASFVP